MAKRKSSTKPKKDEKKAKTNVEEENGEAPEEEYEVEKIIQHRKLANGTIEYLVRWKGYGASDDTWEKESNLTSSALIIAEYKDSISDSDAGEDVGDDANNTNGGGKANDSEDDFDKDDEDTQDDKEAKKSKSKKGRPAKKAEARGRPRGKTGTKKKAKAALSDDDGEETTEEYEVQRIIDVHTGKNGKREYLVRWKGYSEKHDTWEPEEHLTCPDLIETFNKKLDKLKNVSEKSLRVAPAKTDRLSVANSKPTGRHSKRHVGNRKSYAEADD